MDAIERLLALADCWDRTRQVGHTSACMMGARNVPGTVVVVANASERRVVECVGLSKSMTPPRQKAITIDRLSPETLAGQQAPLVVDHHAMSLMIRAAVMEMRNQIKEACVRHD